MIGVPRACQRDGTGNKGRGSRMTVFFSGGGGKLCSYRTRVADMGILVGSGSVTSVYMVRRPNFFCNDYCSYTDVILNNNL